MNFWWDSKVDKKAVLKTLKRMKTTVKYYEDYEIGYRVLVPEKALNAIKRVTKGVNKVDSISAYYKEMKDMDDALNVLNTVECVNDPQLAAYAYGKLFKSAAFFVGKLPFPVATYSAPLNHLGRSFPSIVNKIMPSTHGNEELEDDFKDFLSGGQSFINGR